MFQCSSASRKFLNIAATGAPQRAHPVSVLFSEPKIPQSVCAPGGLLERRAFQCSSASRKFLNRAGRPARARADAVSVLFSEPKIPQWVGERRRQREGRRFSALQRAENSSISRTTSRHVMCSSFQCSSASRKFLNRAGRHGACATRRVSVLFSEPKIPQSTGAAGHRPSQNCFSALQRAENSSIWSARRAPTQRATSFSALQRAENSSITPSHTPNARRVCFSALQRAENSSILAIVVRGAAQRTVSVLFSEPKIPQFCKTCPAICSHAAFQCSSASRKFLNP